MNRLREAKGWSLRVKGHRELMQKVREELLEVDNERVEIEREFGDVLFGLVTQALESGKVLDAV